MADTALILTGGASNFATTSEMLNKDRTNFISNGVVGVITNTSGVAPATGALAVNAQGTPNMTVAVTAGDAVITVTPTSQASQKILGTFAAQNVTIAANSSGGTRYDWIYASASASGAAAPAADGTGVVSIAQSRSTSATTDNGTPPTYGTLIAIVTVTNGASSITNGNIADSRVRAAHVGGLNDVNGNEVVKIVATASAVDEITITNAATGGAPIIEATGSDTNIPLVVRAKGSALTKTSVLRQDDTTNAYKHNSVVLSGWGVITPGVASSGNDTVTFGITFAALPIVVATFGGDHATLGTYGSGAGNIKQGGAEAYSITTTGFTAQVWSKDGTNWGSGNKVFYQWTAIGEQT